VSVSKGLCPSLGKLLAMEDVAAVRRVAQRAIAEITPTR
jgi:hypothetical protein